MAAQTARMARVEKCRSETMTSTSDNTARLPVGVLIPTRDAMQYLRQHLDAMQPWLASVDEIVVVDGFSKDGTIGFLREHLRHPRVRFFLHPPGLYASWNFGLRQLRAEFAYVSTVGDTITADGLHTLLATAKKFTSDAVLSPPRFVSPDGKPADDRWPIHDWIESERITTAAELSGVRAFLLSAANAPRGILGSSAGNLYRTATMRARPFPTEFGHAGDTAWALANALETRLAVCPEAMSTFLVHATQHSRPSDDGPPLRDRLLALAVEKATRFASPAVVQWLADFQNAIRASADADRRYRAMRRPMLPWFLRASTRAGRAEKQTRRATLRELAAQARRSQ